MYTMPRVSTVQTTPRTRHSALLSLVCVAHAIAAWYGIALFILWRLCGPSDPRGSRKGARSHKSAGASVTTVSHSPRCSCCRVSTARRDTRRRMLHTQSAVAACVSAASARVRPSRSCSSKAHGGHSAMPHTCDHSKPSNSSASEPEASSSARRCSKSAITPSCSTHHMRCQPPAVAALPPRRPSPHASCHASGSSVPPSSAAAAAAAAVVPSAAVEAAAAGAGAEV
mmetsp:Transcript_32537/g.82947  ORF Transcript_32537/g.82947 Transcript_32537/m.82947 type:complete len:227 (+) Transcript_32537:48-728(+)